MKYICDAPAGKTWFRFETVAEAATESEQMRHTVEKYFRRERDKASETFQPVSTRFVEQEIGREAHIQRAMPLFLTLRDDDGAGLVTAMLPPGGAEDTTFRPIIVAPANADPYPDYGDAIETLARHFGLALERGRCYPYGRD